VTLDGTPVAVWRSKMTSSHNRNWIDLLPAAEDVIFDAIALGDAGREAYRTRSGLRTAFLQIARDAPRPRVSERVADIDGGAWLATLPHPKSTSVGFDPDRWR
jgi:hypothetical protein